MILKEFFEIDFQSIFEHIFLCKSCVKMPYFPFLKYADFADSRGFLNFLKLDVIHLKLGICKIDHYLKFCQRDCQNFASKQNFKFLKKFDNIKSRVPKPAVRRGRLFLDLRSNSGAMATIFCRDLLLGIWQLLRPA